MSELDAFFAGPFGDGLIGSPFQGLDQPGVAGEPDLSGAGVDAFGEFVGHSQQDGFRHIRTISRLLSAITSDSIMSMTDDAADLYAKWQDALAAKRRNEDGHAWELFDAREQDAYDALIDYLEANDLSGSALDPRSR